MQVHSNLLMKNLVVVEDAINISKTKLPKNLIFHDFEIGIKAKFMLPWQKFVNPVIDLQQIVLRMLLEPVSVKQCVKKDNWIVTILHASSVTYVLVNSVYLSWF